MLLALGCILYLDRQIEKWTPGWVPSPSGNHGVAGVGIFLMLMLLLPLATQELATLLAKESVRPYRGIAGTGSGLLTLHAFLTQFGWFQQISTSMLAFVLVLVMILAALRRAWGRQTHEAITHMAGTVLAMLYLGGLAWFLLALRVKHSLNRTSGFQGSTAAILMILLVVKFTDIGAFFVGTKFGRHKLIPWLSPGKSWEGLAGGIATGALVGMICVWLFQHDLRTMNAAKGLIFGAVIGGVGQAGDLLESLMKRDAEVKDSGQFMPGFGGLLDIIDSPLLAAPVAYLLFSWF
ncbi:MAG: phosphatidate cytidylyltransferase [Tepidisphaeraceae bacterium]|jgi:phosphatidate cytidylyltransferase